MQEGPCMRSEMKYTRNDFRLAMQTILFILLFIAEEIKLILFRGSWNELDH